MHQQIPPTFRHKASCAQTRWSALAVSLQLATLLASCAAPACTALSRNMPGRLG